MQDAADPRDACVRPFIRCDEAGGRGACIEASTRGGGCSTRFLRVGQRQRLQFRCQRQYAARPFEPCQPGAIDDPRGKHHELCACAACHYRLAGAILVQQRPNRSSTAAQRLQRFCWRSSGSAQAWWSPAEWAAHLQGVRRGRPESKVLSAGRPGGRLGRCFQSSASATLAPQRARSGDCGGRCGSDRRGREALASLAAAAPAWSPRGRAPCPGGFLGLARHRRDAPGETSHCRTGATRPARPRAGQQLVSVLAGGIPRRGAPEAVVRIGRDTGTGPRLFHQEAPGIALLGKARASPAVRF
mmetsp:Transcript_76385/g.169291  ORF Transcript_76385/g.169291 Transcript_76385/m.169291 type:complete len:301 (-) Transcript_76385:1136-2038(-)